MREIAVHPNKTGVIVIIYPGYKGDLHGYNGKYRKIAEMLDQKGIGAVVRTSNRPDLPLDEWNYAQWVRENLEEVIAFAMDNAEKISGAPSPNIYLMGVSAGASAIAAVAHKYPQVEKILLIAPSSDAGFPDVMEGIRRYQEELYITVGADDEVVGVSFPGEISKQAGKAKLNQFVIVPNCDHRFRGRQNGRILSKAPLWAFADEKTYPSPEGGMVLYE